ncbi:hypothetical protein GYMLUDRAFT_162068 [Collybiopsis luxurians FD-317 M1]|uniref:Uncharacterized protein n=1 Tax=Collybiopsis luxurians FD-317 M1 TaxID=944289 RepID=A0A0D0C7Q3_9AGAR|nr:hypothetical protein GYMLUDRAFT_162068 [Collybiopsis luxurians FD-317 M1]
MYFLGFNLTPHILEGLISVTTLGLLIYTYHEHIAVAGVAKCKGGKIKALPVSFFACIVTPVHFVAMFITPVAYLLGTSFNGLDEPTWLAQYNLPKEWDMCLGEDGKLMV